MRMTLGVFCPARRQLDRIEHDPVQPDYCRFPIDVGISQPLSGALADRFGAFKVLAGRYGSLICRLSDGAANADLLGADAGYRFIVGIRYGFGRIFHHYGTGSRQKHRLIGAAWLPAWSMQAGPQGNFLFAPLVQGLIALPHIGWTGTFYVWAVIAILILPISWWLAGGKHASHTVHTDNGGQTLKQAVCKAFANRSYILLHLGFFTCGFHIAFLVTHLPTEISLCGLPATVASTSIAIIGLANIAGCIFSGWCTGRFLGKYVLFGLYASRVAMILIYLAAPKTDLNFYLFAAGLGFTWLATVAPTAAITGKLFGTRYLATLFGLTMLSHQIGGFLGSYIGGIVITRFNDYGWMWYADAVLAGAAALLNLLIHERKAAAA